MDYYDYDERARADLEQKRQQEREAEERVRNMIRQEVGRIPKEKTPWGRITALILVFALLGSLLGSVLTSYFIRKNQGQAGNGQNITIRPSEQTDVETAIYQKAKPSVVGITTITEVMNNNFFMQGGVSYQEGVGSGVIISSDGYILTNSHVIRDGKAKTIQVLFATGDTAPAELKFYDVTLDLAIIKVNKKGLTPAELGDSSHIQIGQKAIAIGNPLGLDLYSTMTSGIISGEGRTITLENGLSMDGLLQTDAAINSGNSGGPLYNAQGQVIGINTAKASAEGIGFSIPINIAKPIVDSVIKTGKFEPQQLGIQGIDVSLYQRYINQKLPVEKGVIIQKVVENSAAAKAGLQANDVILKFDGVDIRGMSDLKQKLILVKKGETKEAVIYRNGKQETIQIKF